MKSGLCAKCFPTPPTVSGPAKMIESGFLLCTRFSAAKNGRIIGDRKVLESTKNNEQIYFRPFFPSTSYSDCI